MEVRRNSAGRKRSGVFVFDGCNVRIKVCNCVIGGGEADQKSVLPVVLGENSVCGGVNVEYDEDALKAFSSGSGSSDEDESSSEEECGEKAITSVKAAFEDQKNKVENKEKNSKVQGKAI